MLQMPITPQCSVSVPPYRWRTVGLPSRRILDLFTRWDFGWGARGRIEHYPGLTAALDRGLIGLRLVRLPRDAVDEAAAVPFPRGPKESSEHKRLKRAAVLWMKSEGAVDARTEADCAVGRADAFSADAQWAVECGNTDIRKLLQAIIAKPPFRFTLLPYQNLDDARGRPRRLLAVDLLWGLAAVIEAGRVEEERLELRRAARAKYAAMGFGLPSLSGRA